MSGKIINSGSSSKVRVRSKKRAARQKVVCERGKTGETVTPIIADSIYHLKLKEKKGPDVYKVLGFPEAKGFCFDEFYKDVFGAFTAANRILNKEEVFDCHEAGIDLTMCLYHVLHELKKMIPADLQFDIEEDENGSYYIEVFKFPKFGRGWLYFEVKDLLIQLSYDSKGLHDLFLSFLKMISSGFRVDMWYQGYMGSTVEMMDEQLHNMIDESFVYDNDNDNDNGENEGEDNDENIQIDNYRDDMEQYQSGRPHHYQKLISKSKNYKPAEFIKKVKRFRKAPGIREIMIEGCELLKSGYNIEQYHSPRYIDAREDGYFLELDCQANIIWDSGDNLTSEHEQTLDATANEGIEEAFVYLKITADTKKIEFDELRKKSDWIEKLEAFFCNTNTAIEKYLSKK